MYRIIAVLWAIVLVASHNAEADHKMITKSGCNETCVNSDVWIPYPFGIGSSCYHNSSEHYEIVCKPSNSSPGAFLPFLSKLDIQVFLIGFEYDDDPTYRPDFDTALDLGSDGQMTCITGNYTNTLSVSADRQKICSNSSNSSSNIVKRSLIGSPFSFSDFNQFMVEGCPGRVDIRESSGALLGRCITVCKDDTEAGVTSTRSGDCTGVGCCSISMSETKEYEIQLSPLTYECEPDRNVTMSTCVNVTYQSRDMVRGDSGSGTYQAQWNWKGPQIAKGDSAYHPSFDCDRSKCYCRHGFQGNPYLPYGCQAVNSQSYAKKKTMILGFSISLGSVTMVFFGSGLFRVILRWRQMKRKAAFFKRNGGL